MNKDLYIKQQAYLSEKLKDTTIIVSGATGLIGSRIVRYLFDLNDRCNARIKIIALYRNSDKKGSVYSDTTERKDISYVLFNAEKNIEFDNGCDYIIHCAGVSGGSKMHLKDPIKLFEIGLNGTRLLLDYAVSHKCSGFVYASTYEIYGEINSDSLIKEDQACILDPLVLRNSYAEIKRLCESLCVAYSSKYGINVFSGRLTSTLGTGVSYRDPRFFAEFARCIIENRDIVLKSNGGTIRSYLDSDDAASAFLYLLVNGKSCNAYNLTNMNNVVSIREFAEKLISISGSEIDLRFDIANDITATGYRKESCILMDSSKLEALGWKPVYSMEDTLHKLLITMQKNSF